MYRGNHRARSVIWQSLIYAVLLSSCSTISSIVPGTAQTVDPEPKQLVADVPVNGRVDTGNVPVVDSQPIVRQDGSDTTVSVPLHSSPPTHYRVGQDGDISLNYVDTDVREIARLILGEILKVNYTIEPGFQGSVTIQTAKPIHRDDLIPTLQSLLTQAGGQITYQDGLYRISPQGTDTDIPPIVSATSMESGSQIVGLRYASAKQLAPMLTTYAGDAVKVVADPARNVLVVSGTATARQNVVDLVRVFDVDYLAGQSYALFPAKSGDPSKFAIDLQAALQLDNDGALTGAVKVIPLDEANAVMVVTRQPTYLDRVTRLVNQLDQVKSSAARNIHVYYLKNTLPNDLQPILQRAVNPPNGGGGSGEVAPGNLPPTAMPTQVTTASTTTGAQQSPSSAMGMPSGTSSTTTTASTTSATSPTGDENVQGVSGGDAKGAQIIADNTNNALIVVSTDSEYETIEAAIKKLDVLPMEVLVEATIAEVSLNKNLQYGVQYFLQNKQGQITLSNAQSPTQTVLDPANPLTNADLFPGTLASNFPGLAIARTVGNVQVALQALKTITDVQIISAPKLLIMDRQQASFQVGDLVPTITQSATSVVTAGAPVVNNVQYQATGVILNVTPRINSGGLVTLDLEQEVSDVVPTTTSTINSPTFQQRKVKTKIIVQDGETISLAGLISDKKSKQNSGIPLLQEIPVLGTLFSTKTNTDERTELLVLLTPRVVRNQRDARLLTEELKRKLSPSAILP